MTDLEEAKAALCGYTSFPRIIKGANGSADWDISADIRLILSALATAKQERDNGEKMSQALKTALLVAEARIKELEAKRDALRAAP